MEEIEEYFASDGRVPDAIAYAAAYVPEALQGYLRSRRTVISEQPGHALPKRYANLIFVVLDVAIDNVVGATNHARAALAAGLTQDELVTAFVQAWLIAGFASAWGKVGWRVLRQLESEGLIAPPTPPTPNRSDRVEGAACASNRAPLARD